MDQFTAQQILKVRDALVEKDINEAYHQLYKIASPDFDKMCDEVWTQIESRASEEPAPPTPVDQSFDDAMEAEMNKLPYEKHVDDGQYNDGQLTGFEFGANWARKYLASIPPADGPWHLKSHNNSEDDDTVWMTDGKLSINIDEFNFDDFPEADYWLVNFLNKYQFKLSIDDQSPLIISHLEEQVKELQGRNGLRWVECGPTTDPVRSGIYPVRNGLHYGVCAYDNALGEWNGDWPEWLSDSPAPEQVDVIDAYKEYVQLLTDELSELAGVAAVHGWKSTRHEKGVELRNKIESLQNKIT